MWPLETAALKVSDSSLTRGYLEKKLRPLKPSTLGPLIPICCGNSSTNR